MRGPAVGNIPYTLAMRVVLASAAAALIACAADGVPRADGAPATQSQESLHMRIMVGTKVFTATLSDNKAAEAIRAMLPLTVTMTDLNGNEKYVRLSGDLPHKASKPGTIHEGDVMLYGADTVVLFYKTFSTSYSYTRLGKVDDIAGFAAALGRGNVKVTFDL